MKKIIFNEEARKTLKRGIDAVCDAVKITIGPKGRNVAFDRGFGAPTITNDGVSIAKEVTLEDKFENMGAEIAKEVATKTNSDGGDGTTTSLVLFQSMVKEGMKHADAGLSVVGIKDAITIASKEAVEIIKGFAKPVDGDDEIRQVATISAESADIGKIIGETIQKIGKSGVVTVEESSATGISCHIAEGMEFDRGFASPYMITNPEKMISESKDCAVIVTDRKITSVAEILPIFEKLGTKGQKEVVIICDGFEGQPLVLAIANRLRGNMNILAINAPAYGERKKEMLSDIAAITGATVISQDLGSKLEDMTLEHIGVAGSITASANKTTIIDGKGSAEKVEERIKQLHALRNGQTDAFQKEYYEERIAKLSKGVAILRIGAATETEIKYLKLKIEDAVNATKAAIEEGIVPGGGVALARAAVELKKRSEGKYLDDHEMRVGYEIVINALYSPIRQILKNAGHEDGSAIVSEVMKAGPLAGYDAKANKVVEDMMKAGIVDPVKVTRSGLENAASATGIFLTTEVAIAAIAKEEQE